MTSIKVTFIHSGISAVLGAALLFGASTPLAKLLIQGINPWLLAGLLYLGSGLGLWLYRRFIQAPAVKLPSAEARWLAGSVVLGGIIAPVLLMLGLQGISAANASLLLNAESVFTALLAWFVFRENVDQRVALGMVAIVAGALVLSWDSHATVSGGWLAALAILGACLAWAMDNNLTRKVSLTDASWIAMVKGLVAGSSNLLLALLVGAQWPHLPLIGAAMLLGLFAYGISLSLFIAALRDLGTARAGAYFAVAPFFGALLAVVILHEPVTLALVVAGILMAIGVWLHLTEEHAHEHTHIYMAHEHEHIHDVHHQHLHPFPVAAGVKHSHWHEHMTLSHSHAHYPDAHHQHKHDA